MSNQQPKKVIILLSPGRSGTSLLMQALGAMGMTMSEDMLPGSSGNPDGFFEDKKILELHKNIYDGLNNHPFMPLPENWHNSQVVDEIRPQIKQYLQQKVNNTQTIWGFKDPRTSSLVPLWSRLLNTPGYVPVFIIAMRNPSSVAASLRRQINYEEAATELAWFTRTTDALHHTAADCFIVHYEDWFTHASEVAHGLLKYTGLDEYFTGDVDEALKDVIKPNLNRAVYEDYEVKNDYVLKLYDVLKDCRGDDFDRDRLMATVKECRKAMDGFKGWYMEAQKFLGQANSLREKVQDCRGKLKKQQEQNTALLAAQKKLKTELSQEKSDPKQIKREKQAPIRIQTVPDLDRLIKLCMKNIRDISALKSLWNDIQDTTREIPSKPEILMISGAPRSGIGLLGKCLNLLGVIDSHESELVDKVHGLVFQDSSEFDPLPRGWLQSQAAAQARGMITRAIDKDKTEGLFYLADARFSRSFPLWEQAFSESGLGIRVIHIYRHPWEVVSSMQKEAGLDPHQAGYIWLNCIQGILPVCQKHKHTFLYFDQLLADPLVALNSMIHTLSLPLKIDYKAAEIFQLIQPGMKNHHASIAQLPDKSVFTLHQQVFNELQTLNACISMSFSDLLLKSCHKKQESNEPQRH